MSTDQIARLTRFANQIARNFLAIGHDKAVLATADHIDMFWDPRMKAAMFAADRSALEPIAAAAIEHLAQGNHPASQTRATEFADVDEAGRADAG